VLTVDFITTDTLRTNREAKFLNATNLCLHAPFKNFASPTVSLTLMMIWWLRKAAWVNASVMLFGVQNCEKKLEIS